MALPDKVKLTQVSPTMVEVRGWASEPFVMTEVSARKSLERVRSRRALYSPEDYERHLSVYVEAFLMMGWDIPVDLNAPIPPALEPQAAPQAQPEPEKPSISPVLEPQAATLGSTETSPTVTAVVAQPAAPPETTAQDDFPIVPMEREPPMPGPRRTPSPFQGPEKTWLEKMIEEKLDA